MAHLLPYGGIPDVEVVVARRDFCDRDLPRLLGLNTRLEAVGLTAPPVNLAFEFLETHGLGLVITRHALWIRVLVEPDLPRWLALRKEQQVGLDARVGIEHTIGQANDSVQVALLQQE